jgi:hypothetical protein
MCGWQRICSSTMETFIGILYLLDLHTIGRWKWSLGSLSCILKESSMAAMIQFVGFNLKGNYLK